MRPITALLVSSCLGTLSAGSFAQTAPAAQPDPSVVGAQTDPAAPPAGPAVPVQDTAVSAASADAAAGDIVVTASRIDRAGYTAPTPTTVVGAAVLEQRASVNVADVLNELPSFRRSGSPDSGGIANRGAYNVDLRGLTAIRTLVLLDRLRLPAANYPGSTTAGVPDLNLIPAALISRVDVVTGGASAAYGSDAVAGVVNVQLNTKLEGVKATAQYGATRYDDARDVFSAVALGSSFADGRGHVVAGLEYNDNGGTGLINDKRAWGRRNGGLISLPANRAADLPANLRADQVLYGLATTGGLIAPTAAANPAALRNLQFVVGANGAVTTAPFVAGLYQGAAGNLMVGGVNVSPYQVLRPATNRVTLLGNVSYDLTDEITAWLQPLYSRVDAQNVSAQIRAGNGTGAFLQISRNNPYLQAALTPAQLALIPANGNLSIGYIGNDIGPARIDNSTTTRRLSGGVKGRFGGSWRWDLSGQYSRVRSTQILSNNPITANFNNAINAVLLNGQVVCANAAARAAGCQPINILGSTAVTPQAYAYAFGTSVATGRTTLAEGAVNISGEPFSLWAGPVSIGAGADFRRETFQNVADAISDAGAFTIRAPRSFPRAAQTVKEGYLETIVPLIKDASFTRSLDLNGAVRYTDYSISGGVTTWKVGLTWKPIQDLLIRSTQSRDIRAPTLPELFTASTALIPAPITTAAIDARAPFRNTPYNFTALVGGNTKLTPEIGRTFTVGAVLNPRFVPRLQFSADYFNIRVNNAIGATAATTIAQNCLGTGAASAANPYCQLITFANNDPVSGAIVSVLANNANFAQFRTKGLDLAMSYVQPLDEISSGLPGRIGVNVQATRTFVYRASTDISALYPNGINRAGQSGGANNGVTNGVPKWQVNATFDYKADRLGLNAQVRIIGRGHFNNAFIGPDESGYSPTLFNSINDNTIPTYAYLNLGANYNFGTDSARTEVFVVVNNVTDKSPPLPVLADNAYYDLLGRTYRVGLRFGF